MATRKTFIKNIGNCRYNNIGADLYSTKEGGAVIVFDKFGKTIHRRVDGELAQIEFHSEEAAQDYIDSTGLSGLPLLVEVIERGLN